MQLGCYVKVGYLVLILLYIYICVAALKCSYVASYLAESYFLDFSYN